MNEKTDFVLLLDGLLFIVATFLMIAAALMLLPDSAHAQTAIADLGSFGKLGTRDLAIGGTTMLFDYVIGKTKKVKSNSILEILLSLAKVFLVGLVSRNIKSWLVFVLVLGSGLLSGCSSTERKDAKKQIIQHLKNSGKEFVCTEVKKRCASGSPEELLTEN